MSIEIARIYALALILTVLLPLGAAPVLPGWETDPTAVKGAHKDNAVYVTPEPFKYPYVATYYIKPTVTPEEPVSIGFFVTDFDSSKIRFLDDSHRFTVFLEYRPRGGKSKTLTLSNQKSGDGTFALGKLPVGDYELRLWARDAKGRESHRVLQDFRVRTAASLTIPADKVYTMTASNLAAYGLRNDDDSERIVHVGADGREQVVKEKRGGVPGYTVSVPLDPQTGVVPVRAFEKVTVTYDPGYDRAAVEAQAAKNSAGLQKLLDDKAAAGFRKVVLLKGTYRVSHTSSLEIPDGFTLDMNGATLKLNAFAGDSSLMVRIPSAVDSHVVNGTLEGDYWTHDYANSPKKAEWVSGFETGGDSWYCSFENVTVRDMTGYGGQNGIHKDRKGDLAFIYEYLPKYEPGGLDRRTGEVNAKDKYRFTTDFKDLKKITVDKGRRRLQISKYLGYQGVRTRSWQMTVAWYDASKKFISAETAWQYREMWIPDGAAFLRVSVEAESAEAANKSELLITAFRMPVNCAVKNCTFDHCRCVGYAASAMRNMLFEGNFFTHSGEALARCAFDAEDGADQMQDVYFLKNVFKDNPFNNSILTCAGHNFILEKNKGSVYFWGRTNSPCVRDNDLDHATYWCDSRIRSGYGRFEGNRYAKGLSLGKNEIKERPDAWDYVLSGVTFDGAKESVKLEVGPAGRLVGCTFKDIDGVGVANAYRCTFQNCKGWCSKTDWAEVSAKDCTFKGFYHTNSFTRCRFEKTTFSGLDNRHFITKDSQYTGCKFWGLNNVTYQVTGCTFTDSDIEGGWNWEMPSSLLFRNCTIATKDNAPFVKGGVYAVGKFGFDACKVSGKSALLDIKDIRPHKSAKPEESPDLKPGTIALRHLVWKNESKLVITHAAGKHEPVSTKKLVVIDKGNTLPKDVALAKELFPTWELKK